MQFGCIGKKLSHSFSKELHEQLYNCKYELCELSENELDSFFKSRDFKGINVTMPYKTAVIPFLDEIDEYAEKIGVVNTVVNKNGRLSGYNTDFFGMSNAVNRFMPDVNDKNVLILGTGGTAKTAEAVFNYLGASSISFVSRNENAKLNYENIYDIKSDTEIIVNTTPCGMFPHNQSIPVDISKFPKLCGVFDAVYNPIRTRLVQAAESLGITGIGGLYMLVSQGVKSAELFNSKAYGQETVDRIYSKLLHQKQNIVLCGMPTCGKTTVAKIISQITGRQLYDTDKIFTEKYGEISLFFQKYGEDAFREAETRIIADISRCSGCVIATGGGSVLTPENVNTLKQNGIIYYIDAPFELLKPTPDRPLFSTTESAKSLYEKRLPIYQGVCDEKITSNGDTDMLAAEIIRRHSL